jgi:hypothetical protein
MYSPPGTCCCLDVLCVTLDESEEYTWVGAPYHAEDIDHHYADEVSEEGLRALHEAYQVAAVDPVWGRNDLLWPRLVQAIAESVE